MAEYKRTTSQKIQDEVRNKALHQDIAWEGYRAGTLRELTLAQTKESKDER